MKFKGKLYKFEFLNSGRDITQPSRFEPLPDFAASPYTAIQFHVYELLELQYNAINQTNSHAPLCSRHFTS